MAAFNFFSHGTQDLYPVFLKVQHGFEPKTVSIIAVCYNIASIIGGVFFGSLSEKIGRRKAIMIAAMLALPVIPLWAFASGSLALGAGAFLMQFMVQGHWGVIPTWLNELVPANTRAVLPGFVYQLGNLLASVNATLRHQSPSIMGITTARQWPRGRDGGDCHYRPDLFWSRRPGDPIRRSGTSPAALHQPLTFVTGRGQAPGRIH